MKPQSCEGRRLGTAKRMTNKGKLERDAAAGLVAVASCQANDTERRQMSAGYSALEDAEKAVKDCTIG